MEAASNADVGQKTNSMLVEITTDGVPKLLCPVCKKAMVSLTGYIKHVKKHEPPGGFECNFCDAQFCFEEQLKQHIDIHKTITCRLCADMTFGSAEEYHTHINEKHKAVGGLENKTQKGNSAQQFKCDQCNIRCVTAASLKTHKQNVHKNHQHYSCNVCGKKFKLLAGLAKHERSHVRSNTFNCEFCGEHFAHRQDMVSHYSTGSGIRACNSTLDKHRRRSPDSCEFGEFDASKLRVRKPRVRIRDKTAQQNKSTKPSNRKTKANSRKSAKTKSKEKKRNYDFTSSDPEEFITTDNNNTDSEDDIPLANRIKANATHLKVETNSNELAEENEEFESNISNDEANTGDYKPAFVKEESYNTDFEDASNFVQATCDVKMESSGGEIFFNEKDKLLDVLLSTKDDEKLKPFEILKVEPAPCILDEVAAVPLVAAAETELIEEDVLALKEPTESLESDYERFSDDGSVDYSDVLKSVRSSRRSTTKRKYRRRNADRTSSPVDNGPKRVAKITKKELKERLKMLNKVEKTWKCPHCVKIYHIRKPYEKHLRDDHKLCENDISDIFKDTDEFAKLEKDVFKCKICGKIYLVEKRLLTHMLAHGAAGTLTFKCPCYCNLFFATKEEATLHAQKQHKDLLYCEKCDKYMNGHESLKNHEKNFHANKQPRNQPRNLICDKCGKKFSGRTSLSDHVRSDCGRLPLYQCTVCDKRLSTAGILKTHMLLHQMESPYQCDKCGKTFKVKAQYKSHLKTRHTDFKPYKCHLCPKEYPYRESLLTHMTVHTGIKRFLCNNCGKRFTCISNLQAHRKVQADTCGQLPLNAKATQYMGVQRGKLLMGAKPEAGMEYEDTKTLIAQDVIDRDMPMAQELNFPSEPSAPLATVPLNYASSQLPHNVLQILQAEAQKSN